MKLTEMHRRADLSKLDGKAPSSDNINVQINALRLESAELKRKLEQTQKDFSDFKKTVVRVVQGLTRDIKHVNSQLSSDISDLTLKAIKKDK
jgi:hypothetical protein